MTQRFDPSGAAHLFLDATAAYFNPVAIIMAPSGRVESTSVNRASKSASLTGRPRSLPLTHGSTAVSSCAFCF
ncbi:hypothetical protein FAIPA1_140024 [Frankia sp. AiPs1]